MFSLQEKPTLQQFQEYVATMERERGFDGQGILQECLLLGEEVGELFKAVRKEEGIKIDAHSDVGLVEGELADVFIFCLAIANRKNINLEAAFRKKEEINKQRTWKKHPSSNS